MLALVWTFGAALAADEYPTSPDPRLTPGALCEQPDQIRYPERIKYCERNVSVDDKWKIIRSYQALGFEIPSEKRSDYKIDHLIPLCAGGSNSPMNLWPQHKTVYEKTDRLEQLLCDKMSRGQITQSEAMNWILQAKAKPAEAPAMTKKLAASP